MGTYNNPANYRSGTGDHAVSGPNPQFSGQDDHCFDGFGEAEALAEIAKIPAEIRETTAGTGYGDNSAGQGQNVNTGDQSTYPA